MHVARFAGFALGREVDVAKVVGQLFLGRAKVILSPLLYLYPFNMEGCLEG